MKPRESTEWCRLYWFNTGDGKLPRVLLVGDSIVASYAEAVAKLLEGKVTVAYLATSKCVGDPAIYGELAMVMAGYRFQIVHFNNGLHGFDVSEADYARGLSDFVDAIESLAPEAKRVWASSTPITLVGNPAELDPERNARVCERNRLAAGIMADRNIPVNDLYTSVVGRAELSAGDAYHYTKDGAQVLAEQVAETLTRLLEA